jgi:hypothetical protein
MLQANAAMSARRVGRNGGVVGVEACMAGERVDRAPMLPQR